MAVRRVRELTKPVRCSDAWYNAFLMQCRSGTLDENMYNFFHGFPTGLPTSVEDRRLPTEVQLLLVKASCSCDGSTKVVSHTEFYEPWKQRFLADGVTGYELVSSECAECHRERQRSGEYKWGQSKCGHRDSEFGDQKFDGLPEPRAEFKRDGNVARIL